MIIIAELDRMEDEYCEEYEMTDCSAIVKAIDTALAETDMSLTEAVDRDALYAARRGLTKARAHFHARMLDTLDTRS